MSIVYRNHSLEFFSCHKIFLCHYSITINTAHHAQFATAGGGKAYFDERAP